MLWLVLLVCGLPIAILWWFFTDSFWLFEKLAHLSEIWNKNAKL